MSDKREKSHRKFLEDRTVGQKVKFETVTLEKTFVDKHKKFDFNQNSEEQQSISTTHNEEDPSSKHPQLKKDLKKLFDSFGQGNSDPEVNRSHLNCSETIAPAKEDASTESYTQQSLENVASTDDFSREDNKDSIGDTTLDGKFIEIKDEICDCHAEKCTCGRTEPNSTDIEDSQTHCDNSEVLLSCNCCPHTNLHHVNDAEECSHHREEPHFNRTDRYNYNQIQMQCNRHRKEKTIFNRLFPRREMTNKHHISKDDSGETIPQLYKANVKNLWNCGLPPERFTFKAVTGNLPGKLEYAQCSHYPYMSPYMCPSFSTGKQQVHFLDNNRREMDEKAQKKHKKEKNCIFKHFRRNRKAKLPEKSNSIPHKLETFDKACLSFNGNEYVSTKQLPDRIDIYCFDHLNTSYFRTCDQPPPLITDIAMEKTEEVATRFWAEIFGFIHVIIAFFVAFILQFYKFLLYSIIRPIMVGLVQLTSDYFFKPLLTITYNGFTQPFLVFLFNVAASFRDLCAPIARGLGYFVSEIAVLFRAIRLVECGRNTSYREMKDSYC